MVGSGRHCLDPEPGAERAPRSPSNEGRYHAETQGVPPPLRHWTAKAGWTIQTHFGSPIGVGEGCPVPTSTN